MKILYVCHRFPFPPKRGGKIRPFNMIKHLAADHEVSVASLVRSPDEAREGEGLAPHCTQYVMSEVNPAVQSARMVARLPTWIPSSMGYFYSPKLKRKINDLLARTEFDLIFVHCSSVAQYVASVRNVPKILDFGDMDSQKWLEYAHYKSFPLSWGYWYEGIKMQHAEKQLARQFDLCTATTRAEWDTLESFKAGVASDWFPNGVDSDYFHPSSADYEPDTICFVGRMDYYPNQECMFEFCERTMPLLREQRPDIKLLIVGADPSPAVRKLGELPGVTVTGSVADVRPYLHRCALTVAPLNIARGTQNKILEAMAAGVPTVVSRVASLGVDAVAGEHLLVADTPAEYAQAICRVLEDRSLRTQLAQAGRTRVLSHHAWASSMRRMDGIIERCLTDWMKRGQNHVAQLSG